MTVKFNKIKPQEVDLKKYKAQNNVRRSVEVTGPDVVIASDADADGAHIRGLFSVFIWKHFPELIQSKKFLSLTTPIAFTRKKGKLHQWVYNFDEISKLEGEIHYVKGLGSWDKADLRYIVEVEGLDKMLSPIEYQDENLFYNWFSPDAVEYRKEQLRNAEAFDIMKI